MIEEKVLDKLIQLGRPEQINTTNGQYLYYDYDKCYKKVGKPTLDREVSNIESLAAYLLKLAQRRQIPQHDKPGVLTTVVFSQNTAVCYLRDEPEADTINYRRCLSPQWYYLSEKIGKRLSHNELLRVLQALRPSFTSAESYHEFMRQYRKVSFDEKVTVNSQPLVEQGKGGSNIVIEYNRNNASSQTALPSSLNLRIQFARDSFRFYDIELEIDSALNLDTKEKPKLEFTLLWPEKENVATLAITNEIQDFKSLISKDLPELLVVMNY